MEALNVRFVRGVRVENRILLVNHDMEIKVSKISNTATPQLRVVLREESSPRPPITTLLLFDRG
jgi:hypothetical protein